MATSRNSSMANWRMFGGGGLLLGGLLWLISALATGSPGWLLPLAFLIIGVALLFVAFGQTGGNGAVGDNNAGRISLVVYALGWLLLALNAVVKLPTILLQIAGILIIVGGLLSAYFIYRGTVARGVAGWILFLPAVWGILWVLVTYFGASLGSTMVIAVILAILFMVAGFFYLWNRRA